MLRSVGIVAQVHNRAPTPETSSPAQNKKRPLQNQRRRFFIIYRFPLI